MLESILHFTGQSKSHRQVQKTTFSLGAIMFTLATVATLPIISQQASVTLYLGFIRMAVLLLAASEIISLKFNELSKTHFIISFITIIGYLLYFLSSFFYADFNKGSLYIVASFFICFALELKIFLLVVSREINVKKLMKRDRNIIFNLGFQLIAHIFYLSGTVLHQLEPAFLTFLPGMTNVIGGIALMASISTCFSQYNQPRSSTYRKISMY